MTGSWVTVFWRFSRPVVHPQFLEGRFFTGPHWNPECFLGLLLYGRLWTLIAVLQQLWNWGKLPSAFQLLFAQLGFLMPWTAWEFGKCLEVKKLMNAKFTALHIPSLQGFGPSTANCMESTLAFFSPQPEEIADTSDDYFVSYTKNWQMPQKEI